MTRADFLPGVKFNIKDALGKVPKFATQWCYSPYEMGERTIHIIRGDSAERIQIQVRKTGFVAWSYVGDISIESKLIKYSNCELIQQVEPQPVN